MFGRWVSKRAKQDTGFDMTRLTDIALNDLAFVVGELFDLRRIVAAADHTVSSWIRQILVSPLNIEASGYSSIINLPTHSAKRVPCYTLPKVCMLAQRRHESRSQFG